MALPKPTASSSLMEFSFEGDGILENFYPLLWNKDPVFGTIPSVFIPDTIIIKFGQPISWYFMQKGMLKMKTKDNLKLDKAKEKFLREVPECGVIACFISTRVKEDGSNENIFNYMTKEEFIEFIDNKTNMYTGILQKFVQPKGEHNFIIRAIWSPKTVFFEKRESIKKINDLNFDLYERVLTYEAEDFHSRAVPLRGYAMPNNIQRICHNISKHVSNLSFDTYKIARMVLNFKIDPHGRIWLLYCSSLRIDKGNYLEKDQGPETVFGFNEFPKKFTPVDLNLSLKTPDHIISNLISGSKPLNLHKECRCMKCLDLFPREQTYEVNYKTLIDGFEYNHLGFMSRKDRVKLANPNTEQKLEELDHLRRLAKNTIPIGKEDMRLNSEIPPVIKNIHPKMKPETYQILKLDLSFLKTTTTVCENCMVDLGASKEGHLLTRFTKNEGTYLGKGRLRPDTLLERRKNTLFNIELKNEAERLSELKTGAIGDWLEKEVIVNQKMHEMRVKRSSLLNNYESESLKNSNENLSSIKAKADSFKLRLLPHKLEEIVKKPKTANKFLDLDSIDSVNGQSLLPATATNNGDRKIIGTIYKKKFLDGRLTGFLARRENSVSALSTKTSSLFPLSRKASADIINWENVPGEEGDTVPQKQHIEAEISHRLPKKQYLKSYYSNRSANVSIDSVDKFIESTVLPSSNSDSKRHPFSIKLSHRSTSQKSFH